jgi:hypothetical protein
MPFLGGLKGLLFLGQCKKEPFLVAPSDPLEARRMSHYERPEISRFARLPVTEEETQMAANLEAWFNSMTENSRAPYARDIYRFDHWIPFFFEVRSDRKIDFWSWGKGNEFYLREPGNGVAGGRASRRARASLATPFPELPK